MPGFGLLAMREQESESEGGGRRWGFPLKFLPSNSSSPLPAPTQLRERENSDNNTSANTFANNTPPLSISLAMENCQKWGKWKLIIWNLVVVKIQCQKSVSVYGASSASKKEAVAMTHEFLEGNFLNKMVTGFQSLPLFGLQLGNKSLNFSSTQTALCSWDISASPFFLSSW